jgi:RimJ/RimL family protein N-acetyltransferase
MSPQAIAYRIESPRLLARCWSADDAEAFRALLDANDRHLRPFIPWMRDEPQPLAATRARLAAHRDRFLAGEDFRYALCLRDETLIGELILSTRSGPGTREVGYLVDRGHTGQGLATEATAMALRAAFDGLGIARVLLRCSPENAPSVAVARRLGFSLDWVHAAHSPDSEGVLRDLMDWTIDAAGFRAGPFAALPVRVCDADGNARPLRERVTA